jgi:hypothetical protein
MVTTLVLEMCACGIDLPIDALAEVLNDPSASDRDLSLPGAALPNSLLFLRSPRDMVIPSLLMFTAALPGLTLVEQQQSSRRYRN